jgi:hypothetical protein
MREARIQECAVQVQQPDHSGIVDAVAGAERSAFSGYLPSSFIGFPLSPPAAFQAVRRPVPAKLSLAQRPPAVGAAVRAIAQMVSESPWSAPPARLSPLKIANGNEQLTPPH